MKRSLSTTTLLFASISAILGSGWLFTAYNTSKCAGPASIISWILGGGAVIIIAFVFAELSSMIPITGSSTRIPQYTHGTLVSFIFSWMIWLSYAGLVAAEVQAVIQSCAYYYPSLLHTQHQLSHIGYAAATLIMLLICIINIYSLRWLMKCNNFLTLLKVIIPVLVCVVILSTRLNLHHIFHPAGQTFSPYGYNGIFKAIASGGILFAFNGFKQSCEMAGEAKNPSKSLPIAIIGSVIITLTLYLLLQFAFLSSLSPANLLHGFHNLELRTPFPMILQQDHLTWLNPLLTVGAIIGPLAAALMYMSSSGRSLYGSSKNGYLPAFLQKLNPQGNPMPGIAISFLFGMLMFFEFHSWKTMSEFLNILMALSYAIAPICLLTLRKKMPQQNRPFKLPMATVWANLAFILCNLITYFTGWKIISTLCIALAAGLIILFSYHFCTERGKKVTFDWRASAWLWPYLIGMGLISYLGQPAFSGTGFIPANWDYGVIAIFSIIIMQLAVHCSLKQETTQQYLDALNINKGEC
jgi:amino acid transporter